MLDRFNLKLYRKCPFLYKGKIKKLVSEAREDDVSADINYRKLEEYIADQIDYKFLDELYNKYLCRLTITEYTSPFLLHNPIFIKWLSDNRPWEIPEIPDDMMNMEIVEKYEKYIENKEFFSTVKFPKLFTKSKVIIDKYINTVINDSYISIGSISEFINRIYHDKDVFIQSFEKLKPYIDKDRLEFYRRLADNVKENDLIINYMLDGSILYYKFIIDSKKDYAKKYIIELLQENKVDMSSIWGNTTYETDFDKELIEVVLDKLVNYDRQYYSLEDWIDNDNRKREKAVFVYNMIKNENNISLDSYSFPARVYMFAIIYYGQLHSFLKKDIIDKFLKQEDLVLYILKSNRFSGFYTEYNVSTEILEKNLELFATFFACSNDCNDLCKLIENYNNKELLDFLLTKSINDDKFCKSFERKDNFKNFNKELYDEEICDKLCILLKKDPKFRLLDLNGLLSDSDIFLKKLIDNNMYNEHIYCFNTNAFSRENINRLKYLIPFERLMECVKDSYYLEDRIEVIDVIDLEKSLNKAIEEKNKMFILYFISYSKKNNITSLKIDELVNEGLQYLDNIPKNIIDMIINGDRKSSNILYINNNRAKLFIEKIGDIYSTKDIEILSVLPIEVIEKLNRKHILEIIKLLSNCKVSKENYILLAINIYISMGYSRSLELLNNYYGNINEEKLMLLFSKINTRDALFKKDGKGFIPIGNPKLINMIFGDNYKLDNTPIKNYLNDFKEKEDEIKRLKEKVNNNLDYSQEEKTARIKAIEKQEEKYKTEIIKFMENFADIYNHWDIVEEEFIKKEKKSKLKLKMNINVINEIITNYKRIKYSPELELRDAPLEESDVFEYAGSDNQYVNDVNSVRTRVIELSRGMENITSKKFPNISIEKDNIKLEVFNPQDRNILSAGYKSGCCFRANGNADDSGKNTSLLRYCTHTTYGGGVHIVDEDGNTLMFSPLLRNGNVLMIHSIESLDMKGNKEIVHELLVEFAKKVIEEATKVGDDISFVTITDLHYLDNSYVQGELPKDKKFCIYNENNEYNGMYNNLSSNHMVLAYKEGVTFNDIRYGEVEHDYEYPHNTYYKSLNVNSDIVRRIEEINKLKERIVNIINSSNDSNYYSNNEIVHQLKIEYRKKYKEILDMTDGSVDVVAQYISITRHIRKICESKGTTIPPNISFMCCGMDWYIIVTDDKMLVCDAIDSNNVEFNKRLKFFKEMQLDLKVYENGYKEDPIGTSNTFRV